MILTDTDCILSWQHPAGCPVANVSDIEVLKLTSEKFTSGCIQIWACAAIGTAEQNYVGVETGKHPAFLKLSDYR